MPRKPDTPILLSDKSESEPSLAWLAMLEEKARLYIQDGLDILGEDRPGPNRPGAHRLRQVINWASLARKAIAEGDIDAAVIAAMGAIHCAWMAEVTAGRAIINAGLGTKRGGRKGAASSRDTRRGPKSKRALILDEAKTYKGKPEAMVATIARKTGASEKYVRGVLKNPEL